MHLRYCDEDCLDSDAVKGKIVLCDAFDESDVVALKAGALGSILNNDGTGDFSNVLSLPAIALSHENYIAVKFYMNSTRYGIIWIFDHNLVVSWCFPEMIYSRLLFIEILEQTY